MFELEFKKTDAYREAAKIINLPEERLEQRLLQGLLEERLFDNSVEDAGKTLKALRLLNGMEKAEFYTAVLNRHTTEHELIEFLETLTLFYKNADDPCPECGAEMIREQDGAGNTEWEDSRCSNEHCDYALSGEPDWDIMPGGADYE